MKIALRFEPPLRTWHNRLAEAFRAHSHIVVLEPCHASKHLFPKAKDLVLAVEHRIYNKHPVLLEPAFAVHAQVPDAICGAEFDVTVDLGDAGADYSRAVIAPFFDGIRGEKALIATLLSGRTPLITICEDNESCLIEYVAGLPAVTQPLLLSSALDQVYARLVTLLVKAVNRKGDEHIVPYAGEKRRDPVARLSATPLVFLARSISNKLIQRFGAARGRPDPWKIAYRLTAGANREIKDTRKPQAFTLVDNEDDCFQADPFPFEDGGKLFIFFETYPYATKKGVISLIEIDGNGTASKARTVLEQSYHLSYPFVFCHEGVIYMMPEMSEARCIQLFRADPFPDRWVPDRVLIPNIVAADATMIWHNGRFWLFATVFGHGESSWDQLCLFHAPALEGPWTAHQDNPVLIDAGSARPAGMMWHEGETLMRPAQDCRRAYGDAVAVCQITELNPRAYNQTVITIMGPKAGKINALSPSDASGIHTLNRSAHLEVIDLRLIHRRALSQK